MQQGPLTLSSNKGRYCVCAIGEVPADSEMFPDITAGMAIEVFLGGHWVQGRVQHGYAYAAPDGETIRGYYLIAHDGTVCGLCIGMKVRIP